MARGRRESQWMVMRRCLAIVRRVQRGAANRDQLIEAVLAAEPEAYEGAAGRAVYRRLENDLARIRRHLDVDLYYDRAKSAYDFRDLWVPLLDLPDEDLETIAWLERIFDLDSPQHDQVHALLGKLVLYLPLQRRAHIARCRTALAIDLRQRDEDEIRPAVWDELEKAVLEQRRLELTYLSPTYEDGQPRRHVVDLYDRYYFDAARGHYYLRAYCHRVDWPNGHQDTRAYRTYRLGRIQDVKVLPQKLPSAPPSAPSYPVVYELTAGVARLGVTHQRWISIREIDKDDDGSALVRGDTDSIFWAARTLLHYGSNCRVLGGAELLREMRGIVSEMAAKYDL